MDKTAPSKETPEEARESLIALSYSAPDKALPSKDLPENSNTENAVEGTEVDRKEKFRSELISLSYMQSPETSPATELNG